MTANDVEKILSESIATAMIQVVDDSHLHANHNEQAKSGGTHFTVVIVADDFEGKSLVERHRMVYDALKQAMDEGVHALAIKAFTRQETLPES